jgi:hypothetical protein
LECNGCRYFEDTLQSLFGGGWLVVGRGVGATRKGDRDNDASDHEQRDKFDDAERTGGVGHTISKGIGLDFGKSGQGAAFLRLAGWTRSRRAF